MVANLALSDTIATWRQKTNQLITLTVRDPLFNAKTFRANGGIFRVTSNTFFNGRTTANGLSFVSNANSVFKGLTNIFQRPVTANGSTFTSTANVAISGRINATGPRNIFNRLNVTGNVEGNRLVTTANTIFRGQNIFQGNLTANGNSLTVKSNTTFQTSNTNILGKSLFVRANTTFQGANTNILGKSLFVRANTTFQGANTNIRGKSLFVGANAYFAGSFRGVDLQTLQNVASANNGEVLIYYSANNTWAGGIIDGGSY